MTKKYSKKKVVDNNIIENKDSKAILEKEKTKNKKSIKDNKKAKEKAIRTKVITKITTNKVTKKKKVPIKKNKSIKIKQKNIKKTKEKSKINKNDMEVRKKSGYYLMNKFTKLFDEDCKDFLTTQCNDNYCKYIHNYSKLWKEKTNEEFAKRYYSLYQDFQVILPFEKKFLKKANLDLMFIMDCTGSMSSWISKCQEELLNIINNIKESYPDSKVNIGFVGYRDHSDGENRLIIHEFTENAQEIKDFITKVKAFGGGDLPEDVVGGLDSALKQNWTSKAKYAILVADAPCHGKKYHDVYGDSYPNGCPKKLVLENIIMEYAERDIILSAISINDSTEKMYKIMSNTYQSIAKREIKINKLGTDTSQFGIIVAYGARDTLSSVTIGEMKFKDFLDAIKKETIDNNKDSIIVPETDIKFDINKDETVVKNNIPNSFRSQLKNFFSKINCLIENEEMEVNQKENEKINKIENFDCKKESIFSLNTEIYHMSYSVINSFSPKWNSLSKYKFNSICHNFSIPKDRKSYIDWKDPFIKTSKINCEISISDAPFSEGAMRYAFYLKDLTLDQNMVGKLYKNIIKKEYTLPHLSKDILTIVICQHIAYDFNSRILDIVPDTRLLINFVNAYIYELINYSSNPNVLNRELNHHQQYILVENYIDGDYNKYNNNAGWINDNLNETSLIAQTFSHFSWQITRGYLMIVDLQGVNGILTDPQIHCLDNKKFGKGNLGYIGIMKFFMSHICNEYCRKLNLFHPKKYIEINSEFDFFIEKYIPPPADLIVYKVCDLCLKPFKIQAKKLYENKKKCWDSFCDSCDDKRKNSFVKAKCEKCNWIFVSSDYFYKIKREEFPKICQKCKIDDGINERNEFNQMNNIEKKLDI